MTQEETHKMSEIETLDLPQIINGRFIYPKERERVHVLSYETGLRIRLPTMEEDDLARIQQERRTLSRALTRLTTDELTRYLAIAGERWLAQRTEGRQLANAYSHRITGFSPAILTADYETIGHFLVQRHHIWDTIAAELGNERIFDEWIPNQMCHVRAVPRGLLVQYLVGNLPLAGMYTVIRGILTRNVSLLKLPSRDPVTVYGLVQSIISVDPEHPISRALSVVYWPHESAIGNKCVGTADAVCVWGGGEAVEAVKRRVRANVPVSEYGPRWSASVIDLTACDPEEAAVHLVEDVGFYDQEACFNTQRAFVKGDITRFREYLAKYFESFSRRYPLASNRDALAHRSATLLEAGYLGLEVDQGRDWAIVVVPKGSKVPTLNNPLGRTVFLHHTDDLTDAAAHLNEYSQTVSVMPWSLSHTLRDELSWSGACRIVELGWSRLPRQGFSHDGMYGLHALIRLVVVERDRSDFGKYYPAPAESTTWQRQYLLGEKWWRDPWWEQIGPPKAPEGNPAS